MAFLGLVLPFSGLPAAFWGSRHLRSVLGVRGSLVSLVGELVRKAQLGHQPNLGFCLLVSQQTLALYFFLAFFALFLFFCWRLGIAAGAAGIRLGCHLGPSAVVVCVLDAEATRNTGKQNASARARQRCLLFLGPRQDESSWRCTARGPVGEAHGDIIN